MTTTIALSPLESLCFDQINFWVGVVRNNNGRSGRMVNGKPWTRLPAMDLVNNLEERFSFLKITERQVRRALKRLVDLKLVVRAQFWQSERWRSDYFYSLGPSHGMVSAGELEEQQPETADRKEPSVTPADPIEAEDVAAPMPEPVTSSCTPEAPIQAAEPLAPTVEASPAGPAAPMGGSGPVWDRIRALAAQFNPADVERSSPSKVIIGGRLHRVHDGDCEPLR